MPGPDPDPYAERTLRVFFEGEREREVNDVLRTAHDDVASLRRNLVDYGYLERPGGVYSVVTRLPGRSADEAQEVPADEAARLAAVPHADD